jgi:L-methionine (R)-S-oxide reductase
MFSLSRAAWTDKAEGYDALAGSLVALLDGEDDLVANAANAASLIWHTLPDLNWAGFYFLMGDELVLGPFQGRPACVRIAIGKGVCGTAAARRATVIVKNVHEFAGHIACDSASNSEIVVPLVRGNELIGVLDLDSPKFERFDAEDQAGLEKVVAEVLKAI